MTNKTQTVGKTTEQLRKEAQQRKEERDRKYNQDYKRCYTDKSTGLTTIYYTTYRYDYKEYMQIKQLAYTKMQQYNKKIYNNKEIDNKDKQFITYEEALKTILRLPKSKVLAALENYKQQQELKQEAKIYQREQQLDKAEEAANNYFTVIQQKKRNNLIRFIEAIKAHNPKALEYFRNLKPEQQEELVNKVDNYLYNLDHQDVEISISYIENVKKGGDA